MAKQFFTNHIFVSCWEIIVFGLIFVLSLTISSPAFGQEVEAIRLEQEIEVLEKEGKKDQADFKRTQLLQIRKNNFARPKPFEYQTGNNEPPVLQPFDSGTKVLLKGFWEVGFRGNLSNGDFRSGQDWLFDSPETAIQAGSFYMPRNYLGYQNQSVLPLIEGPKRIRSKDGAIPSLQITFMAENRKWSIEYSNTPINGAYDHNAYGLGFQFAKYQSSFHMNDHRLAVKIHEKVDKLLWFSWDFGIRAGGWKTESSFLSPTLNQTGDLKETGKFLAPSTGFRFYVPIMDFGRIELGSDLFYTPVASLMYERRFMREGGIDSFGNRIQGSQMYKIESDHPAPMTVGGADATAVVSLLLMQNHRFSFGSKVTGYSWIVNESQTPRFTAVGDSLSSAIIDWYKTSAVYEADGNGERSSRYFTVTNFFIGYNYVF
ncbi:MAG: hypothetical protein SH817_08980 [Leptospira sp.]|nr:hypothetical protein [Leptospira sp.]